MRKCFVILFVCLLFGCQQGQPEGATLEPLSNSANNTQKNVIVIVIDSMTQTLIEKGIEQNSLPALSYLIQNGRVYHDLVAPFPSMSVTIESSLITGTSPRNHQIPGLVWYDPAGDVIVDYGSTFAKMWKLGLNDSLMNSIVHLNTNHLSPNTETIYEALNKKGYSSGSINMIMYRGETTHPINMPNYVNNLLHLPEKLETRGPDLLTYGQVVQPKIIQKKSLDDHLYQRFGFNDSFSADVTASLIKEKQQPQFLMVFFPTFDKEAHYNGPLSFEHFAKVDRHLQTIFQAYNSWDEALEENIFVVMGDHGQDSLKEKAEEAAIELEPLLKPFQVAPLMDEPSSGDIVIANNHRSAYLYKTNPNISFHDIAGLLSEDYRIDHLAWINDNELLLYQKGKKDVLHVRKGGDWSDSYEQTWSIEGNEQIAGIKLNHEDATIQYGEYPDIFHQLFEALSSHSESMIVTAKPGYTLKSEGAPVHNQGGEHGGLHKNDTITSIVIAGTDKPLPERRIQALKEYFLSFYD